MFLEDIDKQLKEHAARFDLENRAVQGCKQNLRTLLEEDPEEARFYLRGFALDELKFQFVHHRFTFGSWRSWPHILSRVTFGCHAEFFVFNIEPFGYYDLETVENGEISDDWFWWEEMRDENGKLIEFSDVQP